MDGLAFQLQDHGGITRVFRELLPALASHARIDGIDLYLLGRERSALPADKRIDVHRLPRVDDLVRPSRVLDLVRQDLRRRVLNAYIRDRRSVWQATYYTEPARFCGPRVVFVYDMAHEQRKDLFPGKVCDRFRERKRRCIANAEAIVCISHATRRSLLDHGFARPGAVHVVPLAVGGSFRDGGVRRPSERPYFLYVGARGGHKNFELMLRAWATWRHRARFQLQVVGPPWTRAETRMVADLGVASSVVGARAENDGKLRDLYLGATALVYPSLIEGFGLPLLEAMACECPVLASDIPSTREVAGDVPTYFDPESITSLERHLSALALAVPHARRLADGKQRALARTWGAVASDLVAIYDTLEPS